MPCDGLKKPLLEDLDGSFLHFTGAVIPESEWKWNGDDDGDRAFGTGDYRIPKDMQMTLDGVKIPIDTVRKYTGRYYSHYRSK